MVWSMPLLALLAAVKGTSPATLRIARQAAGSVSPSFVGVNIDAASLYQGTPPHRLAFNDGRLVDLSKTLAGEYAGQEERMVLRVGGSSADGLWWGGAYINGSNASKSKPFGGQRIQVDQR